MPNKELPKFELEEIHFFSLSVNKDSAIIRIFDYGPEYVATGYDDCGKVILNTTHTRSTVIEAVRECRESLENIYIETGKFRGKS